MRAPQPATVRDHVVLHRPAAGNELRPLVAVTDNHQRLNRNRLAPIEATAIPVHLTTTSGDPTARIFEIRCYE